jgi:glycosyltransferase A (GT-A) superfamily protein (DUF2064 family)
MLKRPQLSKRRIAATLGSLADEVAALLLNCALEDLARWPGSVCLAPANSTDLAWAETLLTNSAGRRYIVAQREGNLGQRIMQVDQLLRSQGEDKIIMLGTDCPTLTAEYIGQADAELKRHAVVLGPARDGGVVLMGASRQWPDLEPLPWSTSRLRQALTSLCEGNGDQVKCLGELADIDNQADLVGLRTSLGNDDRPARQALGRWLDRHHPRLSNAS